jgi:ABC-2 type transport system ATP-binding protein
MEYVLQTNGLTKIFGKKIAVNKVSMNVKKGDIYGLIGRNGAGKTTLIRMVSGLARPKEGTVSLFESSDLELQRKRTGTMIENPAVYPSMTARQNLIYYCLLLGMNPDETVDRMLELVGLSQTGKKKAKNFSLGMKQRLAIAIALLGNPEFLLLDEPINGLDPSGIVEVRELILKLNKENNITILVSSHILGELSKIANRYGVINNGILVDEFTNEDLLKRCVAEIEIKVDDTSKAKKILESILDNAGIRILSDQTIRIKCDPDKAGFINTELAKTGVVVMSSTTVGQDLEDYFMKLMDQTPKLLQ